MVTIKNADLMGVEGALEQLLKYAMPVQTAMRLRKAVRPVTTHLTDVKNEIQRLIDRYGKRGADGQLLHRGQQPIFADETGFNQEYKALMELEEDFDPISIDDLKIIEDIRGSLLINLGRLLAGPLAIQGDAAEVAYGDLASTANGVRQLADRDLPREKSVKLWRIFSQLRDISDVASEERRQLLDQYAKRDVNGDWIYLDRASERVDVEDDFYLMEKGLLRRTERVEGIPLDWYEAVEKKHGKLPGEIVIALGDLLIIPDEESEEADE